MEVTVAEYRHPVLAKGQYQIVALMQAPSYEPGIANHAVATLAGAILRQDLSLFEARAWLELLLEGEAITRPDASPVRMRR